MADLHTEQDMPPAGSPTTRPSVVLRRQLPRFNSRRLSSRGSSLSEGGGNDITVTQATTTNKTQPHEVVNADTLMAHGLHAMNESLATIVEGALGGTPMPSMDVRFQDLTITAKLTLPAPMANDAPQASTLLTPAKNLVNRVLSRHQVVEKPILRGLTGAFRPGRLSLVLGQPGSGKSSLMKILSGRFPLGKEITVSGEISYGGLPSAQLQTRLPRYVSYVDASDAHFGRMTVEETLQFAYTCTAGKSLPAWVERAGASLPTTSDQRQLALETLTAHHAHAADLVVKRVGLEAEKQSLVGDHATPGLGLPPGERKRVTVGEMGFGLKLVHLLDEVSAGLDATATLDMVDSLKSMATSFQRTVVASLAQITPDVFALFDDILLLHEGYVVYQGPREQALPYFESLGYLCPPRKDVVDFLLEMGTSKQDQYAQAAANGTTRPPRSGAEFADRFQRSEMFQQVHAYMGTAPPTAELMMQDPLEMPAFLQGFKEEVGVLLRRQWLLTTRNKAFYMARTFMVLLMGVLYGTSFWQLQDTNPQLALGLLFSCSMFLSLGQAAQIPVFLASRAVFYKQRGANFYRTSSYVIASCLAQLPFALFETILFGSLLYWMGGYASLADRFLVFVVTLFLCQMCFTALFFLLAAAAPTMAIAQPLMVIIVLVFTLFGGFLVTKNNIPSYFLWVYWINPIAWCIRGLSVNQYTAPQYKTCTYKGIPYCEQYGPGVTMSKASLATFDLDDDTMWIYYTWIMFVVSYIVLSGVAYLWLEYKRYENPENTTAATSDIQTVTRELETQTNGTSSGVAATKSGHGEDNNNDVYILQAETPMASRTQDAEAATSITVTDLAEDQDETAVMDGDVALVIPRPGVSGFVPVTLAFQDLWYTVPLPGRGARSGVDEEQGVREEVDLLCGVTGFALPGTMTALMGSAGAGKTTLLDVIAGRTPSIKNGGGVVRGDVFLNGYPATELAMRRCSGYGHQHDIHADSATIREAMVFSALLRQDANIPTSEKMACVEMCIDLLELRPIANKIIRGSSPAQMKRITIGVELAASPSVVFMDNPTNGLDALSAQVVMNGLRKVADTGRTVICTLRDPSADVFELFDSALVLQRGGKTAFFGETGAHSSKMIDYFESIPGIAPLKPGYNPASWVMDCLGDGISRRVHQHRHHEPQQPVVERRRSRLGSAENSSHSHARRLSRSISSALAPPPLLMDMAAYYEDSDHGRILDEDMDQDGITRPSMYLPEITFDTKRAAPSSTQFVLLTKRIIRMYWRTPAYNLTRFMLSIVLALLFGLAYQGTDYTVFRGANAAVGMIFLSTIFFGLIAFNSVLPIAAAERAVFYRERSSQTYNALWYYLGTPIVEVPYVFVAGLLFTSILFPLAGFEGSSQFLMYWLIISLHVLLQVYMAQFMVYVLPSVQAASGLGALLSSVFLLFAGFNPPASKIPSVYKWIHYASPPTYSIAALTATVLTECSSLGGPELGCQPLGNAPARLAGASLKVYIEAIFLMKHDEIWQNIGILLALILLFRGLALLALRFVHHG